MFYFKAHLFSRALGREGCCKEITLACARSVSAPLGLPCSRCTNRSGSMLLCWEPSEAGPRLHAPPRSKPLRLGSQVALTPEAQIRLGLRFVPFPGPSSSVFGERGRCDLSPVPAAQFSGCAAGAPCQADGDCPGPQEVLAKKPASSLVGKVSPRLQLPLSSPYGSGFLSLEGDGMQLAISVPSFVLCAVLVVSYVRAFRVVAIPQSRMLAQVCLFWLHLQHSSPILKKHCSPCLPAQPPLARGGCRRLRCFSAGGVTVGLVICWF